MSSSLGFAGLSRARSTRARRDQIRLCSKCRDSTRATDQHDGPTISVPFRATLPLRKGISDTPSGGRSSPMAASESRGLNSILREAVSGLKLAGVKAFGELDINQPQQAA